MIELKLSEDEYAKLVELVFMGHWVRTARTEGDLVTEHDPVEQKVLAAYPRPAEEAMVQYDEEHKTYYASGAVEERCLEWMREYEEQSFWKEIVKRLGLRDLIREKGEKGFEKMDEFKRMEAMDEAEAKYAEEFEARGIERLEIVK